MGSFFLSSLSIASPTTYRTYQRNGSNQADIPISGTYAGTPSAIEARFNGGTWTTIVASPSGGTFSGTLTGQATGQGTLEVRFANLPTITASVQFVGIGDVYIIGGQSNASGRGTTNQTVTSPAGNPTLKATNFQNSYVWGILTDPFDSNTNQVDSVSSNDAAGASCWIPLATTYLSNRGYPVAFVPCPLQGTSITAWQPGADHQNRATLYGSMVYRYFQVGGAKALLWWQGETDANAGMSAATYQGHLETIANAWNADTGLKMYVTKLQNCTGADVTTINSAIVAAIAANAFIEAGPDLSDITTDDTFHLTTTTKLQTAADRWWTILNAAFP